MRRRLAELVLADLMHKYVGGFICVISFYILLKAGV